MSMASWYRSTVATGCEPNIADLELIQLATVL
jgi:hypothetical protein